MPAFVHLHLHSEYSLVDSTIRIPELVARCVAHGQPAVAVTDQNNLFALVKFYKAAEGAGIKPIAGADLLLADGNEAAHAPDACCAATATATSACRACSRARGWKAIATMACVRAPGRGCATPTPACSRSPAATAKPAAWPPRASTTSPSNGSRNWQRDTGERLHLELTRTARDGEDAFNAFALHASARRGMPVIASNDVRFLDADGFDAHEARVCIATGRVLDDPKRPRDYSAEQYLKSSEEMSDAVRRRARCDRQRDRAGHALQPRTAPGHVLPARLPGARRRNARQLDPQRRRAKACASAWTKAPIAAGHTREGYFERLEIELDVIVKMGFPGYFLIVADFINWAKDQHGGAGRDPEAGHRSHRGELTRAMKDASFVEQLHKNGVDPADPDPAEFSAFIAKEIVLWGDAVKVAGVTLQ